MKPRELVTLLAAAAMAWPLAGAAHDQVADFYKGRQVTVVVGYGPGGSASFYAQALAHHVGRRSAREKNRISLR
jgi:hypothetical protein